MDELFEDMKIIQDNKKCNKKDNKIKMFCKIYGTPNDNLFLIYYKSFIPKHIADNYFDLFEKYIIYNSAESSKIKIFGKEIEIPRKQVAYGDPGTFYNFSGLKVDAISWNDDNPLCNVLNKLKTAVNNQFCQNFNFVLINRYANGSDYIGFHADDENDLSYYSPIVGLSFGAERDIQFKNSDSGINYEFDNKKNSLKLEHGSCISINYPTNNFWKHSIPKRANVKSPRINLTFRVMNI